MNRLEIIKDKVKEILPSVKFVIGYSEGFDSLHSAPHFVKEEEDIAKLIWNEFCINNLSTYLAPQKWGTLGPLGPDEKIGVIVKGCDSRSVMELLKEGVVSRENLVILGIPCQGKVDLRKLKR
ncbi:MAG: 4Fe-4S ferredoxin, partial [Thermodesulfobacteriota bacterium]